MKIPRRLALAVSLLLAACGGSDGNGTDPTPTPQVGSVTVSPLTSTLEVGETVQMSAQAFSTTGSIMNGQTFSWASNATGVATVSSSGLVTAVSAGTAAITATTSGVAGSGTVTVQEVAVACTNPQTVALAAGGSTSYDAGACVVLPAGSNGDRYRVAVIRDVESNSSSDVADVQLRVTALGSQQSAPVSFQAAASPRDATGLRPIPGLDPVALVRAAQVAEATSRAHMRIWEDGRRATEGRDDLELLPSRDRMIPRLLAASPDTITLNKRGSTCEATGGTVTAVLIFENDDVAVYQDVAQRAGRPITTAQAQRLAEYHSDFGKDLVDNYFGNVPDVDGNGKIVVMASPEVDEVSAGSVAAFIWPLDFYTEESCPSSNAMELVYFNADLIRAMDQNSNFQALPTVPHEAQHLSSIYRRIAASPTKGTDRFHPGWILEGRAEIAAVMSSRLAWAAIDGPAVGSMMDRDDFAQFGIIADNYGVALAMARTLWYLSSQPNGLTVTPNGAGDGHSVYGTGWHFHRWLGDTYANSVTPQGDAALFRALTDSLAGQGSLGLTEQTGKSFQQLMEEFVVTVMLHKTGAPEGDRDFTSYDFVSATDRLLQNQVAGLYPWPVTGTSGPAGFSSAKYEGRIGPTGVRIHDFVSSGTGSGAQITVTMDKPGRIVVARIR